MHSGTKVVHERVSESSSRTMQHTVLEGALNCIATNKDSSQVVVAGRNVFKIFSIEDDQFVEKHNLRVGRNINLNFSASNVAWNPVDDHILASAATNSSVVIWDLNKTSRSKLDTVYSEHRRFVSKVAFHHTESHLLLSGSQDGFMKLFDLKKKEVCTTFSGRSESVRDVTFNPHHYFQFAAAFENGNVQIWDLRKLDKWERQFTAHSGPIFSLDWHPDDKNILASAGRDKTIKIWDMQLLKPKNLHTVQSIASVARCKWRPQRKYHIASCALLVDCSVNVWDIRRPYIPFAAFKEHKDVVTGIVWKQNDPHVFLSSSKDCTLWQHMFKDASRPANSANPVGLSINIRGDVSHAFSDKLVSGNKSGSSYTSTILPSFFVRKTVDKTDQFTMVSSSLSVHELCEQEFSMDWFIETALKYKLSGRSLSELCDHNTAVAKSLKRHQIAQTWQMVKLFFAEVPITPAQTRTASVMANANDAHKSIDDRSKGSLNGSHLQDNKTINAVPEHQTGDTSTGISDESDIDDSETEKNLTSIASGLTNQHGDFFFGDGEVDQTTFEDETLANLESNREWSKLPNEAFQPRHEIIDRTSSPDHLQHTEEPSSGNNDSDSNTQQMEIQEFGNNQKILQAPPFISTLHSWKFVDNVKKILHYYAEQSDVQMSVSLLVVLGDKIRDHIDELTQEHWFISYIELLSRFKLYTVANEVIKLSNHASVSVLNQESTTIHTNCNNCSKSLLRSGWVCDRCKKITNTCSICHLVVKGLYVWCQGCSHGGHIQHIKDWFSRSRNCPTGCGHLCEFT